MCFYNDDCDWTATINERAFVRTDKPARCHECGRQIAAGEWRSEVFQQEHEMCQICEDEWSDYYTSGDADSYDTDEEHAAALAELADHKHGYGETFSATVCRECCLVLEAVYDLEAKEGCPEYARQPLYGELADILHEDRRHGDAKYARHAIELFPELVTHFICRLS